MSNAWPDVPLGEVLVRSEQFVDLVPTEQYKEVTIRLWGKGVVLRGIVTGSDIAAARRIVVRAGQFIFSRIDARNGALGLVPDDLDGAVVSSDFPTYNLVEARLDRRFMNWLSRTAQFVDLCRAASEGTTNRVRLQEDRFLAMSISLPPLSEQRRIVAKIEQLASKIAEARGLRGKSVVEADVLFATTCRELFLSGGWPLATVEEIVGQQNLRNGKSVKVGDHPDGIRCLRLSAMRDGRLDYDESKIVPLTAVEAKEYLIQAGDVFVMRGNGSKDLVGRAALARESQSRTIFPDLLIRIPLGGTPWSPDFFVAYWNCPVMRRTIVDAAKTTSGIWKINQGHIASFHVPIPPLPEQRRIVAYLDDLQAKVEQLKTLQAQTAAELDALLPSILDRAFRGEL